MDNTSIIGPWERIEDVPATTSLSDQISRDLKKVGVQVCWRNDHVCVHAGYGYGERPFFRLLCFSGDGKQNTKEKIE